MKPRLTPQDVGFKQWPWGEWCIVTDPGMPSSVRLFCVGGTDGILVFKDPTDYSLGYVTVVLGGDLTVVLDNERTDL